MKKTCLIIFGSWISLVSINSQISSSFELRYFSKDKITEGHTDFKGEREFFNTEQRIDFLEVYADVASRWFLDSALNRKVNEPGETERFLNDLKKKPLPVKRRRIYLESWRTVGIKASESGMSRDSLHGWSSLDGVQINNGFMQLNLANVKIERKLDSLQWRFYLSWRAMCTKAKTSMSIGLKNKGTIIAEAGFHSNGSIFYTDNGMDRIGEAFILNKWYEFKMEADLVNDRYNLYINGNKSADWVALKNSSLINGLLISGGEGIIIDDMKGLKFDTSGCVRNQPFTITPFIQENFNPQISNDNWYKHVYDDRNWVEQYLPIVRGGAYEEGEDLYLRKKINIGSFEEAWLNIETLDPGGEIWINGKNVFVTHKRHPIRIDISNFLLPYKENIIAIKVNSFYNEGPLYHSPLDRNVGWFCGRAWIDFSEKVNIVSAKTYTASLMKGAAEQMHHIELQNNTDSTFNGNIIIDYYPWFPYDGITKIASFEYPVELFAHDSIHLIKKDIIEKPLLWTHDNPNLYKVHVKIMREGILVDDEIHTTGIRTVSQEGGVFRINGEAELLAGAQTMGFRMPIENIVKWNRCPPSSILADELLACKKLGNALRIHIHAGGKYAYSVNDPRVAEMADQLGLMLIWPSSSWIREGEWGGIDFEGYPKYIDQVFNHPSIIMWEGANHPNKFAGKPLSYSNKFITKIYHTIYSADSSRLISPASYNKHFAYGNDLGTIDQDSTRIIPCKEWTAPMVVRGNQDALTGYGAEWQNIRKWPDPYRRSFLESPERAYFNFEHEESIGMQNFSLVKGKPWYEMPSYENIYDRGSIGREFAYSEWRASQAWQAFSAWESMKWQRIFDIDGFSWCCLHGGPNSGTYRKPLIDAMGHAKLAFYSNKMALQDIVAGSDNSDVVYSKKDKLSPIILNVGDSRNVKLKIIIKTTEGQTVDTREFPDIRLEKGRTLKKIPPFKPKFEEEGYYIIEYFVLRS